MTETRIMEMEESAIMIMDAISDIEQVVRFHPATSSDQGFKDEVCQRLKGIKSLSGKLRRREPRANLELEPLDREILTLTNALKSLKVMSERNVLRGGVRHMHNGELQIISNLACLVCNSVKEIVCLRNERQLESSGQVAA